MKPPKMRGQTFAVISGILAALASLSGKFATSQIEALELCETVKSLSSELFALENSKDSEMCLHYLLYIRVIFFLCMIAINCVMWTTFTKALSLSATSLEATLINTASNFFCTAALGQILFDEVVTGLWWMGTVLVIGGLMLIHSSNNLPPRKPGTRKKQF